MNCIVALPDVSVGARTNPTPPLCGTSKVTVMWGGKHLATSTTWVPIGPYEGVSVSDGPEEQSGRTIGTVVLVGAVVVDIAVGGMASVTRGAHVVLVGATALVPVPMVVGTAEIASVVVVEAAFDRAEPDWFAVAVGDGTGGEVMVAVVEGACDPGMLQSRADPGSDVSVPTPPATCSALRLEAQPLIATSAKVHAASRCTPTCLMSATSGSRRYREASAGASRPSPDEHCP